MRCPPNKIVEKWVLVYQGGTYILNQYYENKTVWTPETIEIFDTESEMDSRISTLGLTPRFSGE